MLIGCLQSSTERYVHDWCCRSHKAAAERAAAAAGRAARAAAQDIAASAAASQAARPTALCNCKKPGGVKGKSVERCCRRAGHGDGVGHDFDKKRRERVVSRILLLMARPGQTTGPLFRPVGEAVEMECMRAFREEWGSCVENGFKDFDKAKKDALWKEWSKRVDENFARKVKSGLLSADDLNAIRNHFGLDSRSFKGVEGSARNDGVGGNGDGGVGNGDAAEASAESPVKAAKGGGNQGATISPDGDKQRDTRQRDKQQPDKQRPDKQQPDKQQSSLFNCVEVRKPAGIYSTRYNCWCKYGLRSN